MSKASRDEVIAAFDEVIAERGEDWVYPQFDADLTADEALQVTDEWHADGLCRYVKDTGEYACVWGGVFAKVAPKVLPKLAHTTDAIGMIIDRITIPDPAMRTAAAWTQAAQDRGMPYAEVREGFHRILNMGEAELGAFSIHEDLVQAGYPQRFN
jgi:hypothetical protein